MINSRTAERRARPAVRRSVSTVRIAAQGIAAAGLLAAGVIWASARGPVDTARPGERLSLPAAVIAAPKGTGALRLDYLSAATGTEISAPAIPGADLSSPVAHRIALVLRKYARDDRVADRAAVAVVREGRKHNIDPLLIVGVMLTENAKIDPAARSFVGATGLMQIMPFHRGEWKNCKSNNLVNVETNICYGTNILASYIKGSRNMNKALLRYNGCVRGRNTPNCHTYSSKVLRHANLASRQMLTFAAAEARARIASSRRSPGAE